MDKKELQDRLKELQDRVDEIHAALESCASQPLAGGGGSGAELGSPQGSDAASGSKPHILAIHEHYKIYRSYVEHEDELINSRQMWNITIQGFLFATYGFSVQKLLEVSARACPISTQGCTGTETYLGELVALKWLICTLPLFGAAISVVSAIGVQAAKRALDGLKNEWDEIKEAEGKKCNLPTLPSLTGGGHSPDSDADINHESGFNAPRYFPWFFVGAWCLLLVGYGLGPQLVSIWATNFSYWTDKPALLFILCLVLSGLLIALIYYRGSRMVPTTETHRKT